jgi:hypothetical protein
VLQVEEVRAMAELLQFGGYGSHDGNDRGSLQPIVNGSQRIDAKHGPVLSTFDV